MGRPRANRSEVQVKCTGGQCFSLRRVLHPEPGLPSYKVRARVEKAGRGCPGGEGLSLPDISLPHKVLPVLALGRLSDHSLAVSSTSPGPTKSPKQLRKP